MAVGPFSKPSAPLSLSVLVWGSGHTATNSEGRRRPGRILAGGERAVIDRCPLPVFLPLELFFISCSWHSAGQPGAPVSALLHLLLTWAAAAEKRPGDALPASQGLGREGGCSARSCHTGPPLLGASCCCTALRAEPACFRNRTQDSVCVFSSSVACNAWFPLNLQSERPDFLPYFS